MKKFARKYALFIILIAFAVTMILWPLAATQSIQSTQEDPGTAQSDFTVSLTSVLDYGDIAGILASGGYESIEEMLQEIDFDSDDIPVNIRFIYQTYNDLLSDLTTKLGKMDEILDNAEEHLNEGEFDETYLNLTNAEYLAEDIEVSLEDMHSANEQIINILGNFAPKNQMEVVEELEARLLEDKERLDALKAAYEESAPEKISTVLYLEVPRRVFPGLPYTISGQITYDGEIPLIDRDITLLWDNEPLDTAHAYQAQDTFEIEVTPAENTLLGEHKLTVIIEAQDEYGIASENATLTVTRELPEIRIEELSYNYLSRKVEIRGRLDSKNPLNEALIVIELKGKSIRVSPSPEGEFEASIGLPLSLINLGKQEVKIRFESSATWLSPTELTAEIFVLDIFSLGFISTAFAAVGMIVYVTKRSKPGKGGSWILETPPPTESALDFTSIPLQEFEGEFLEGTRGQIAKAYIETMKLVENDAGVPVKPCMTLREFLKEAAPKLNGAAEAFNELTRLAEDALYSPRIPGSDKTERAKNLAMTIKAVLRS